MTSRTVFLACISLVAAALGTAFLAGCNAPMAPTARLGPTFERQDMILARAGLMRRMPADPDQEARTPGLIEGPEPVTPAVTATTPETQPRIDIESIDTNPDAPKPDPRPDTPKPQPEPHKDGLEAAKGWRSVPWAMPTTAVTRAAAGIGSGQVLVITPEVPAETKPGKDKAAVGLRPTPAPATTPATRLVLDIDVAGARSASLAVALEVDAKRTYYESTVVPLQPGMNRAITFSLGASSWKTQATEWRNETTVSPGSIQQILLLLYNPTPGLKLTVDNLRLEE